MLRTLINSASVALACLCVVTTTVQAAVLMMAWIQGRITQDKVLRMTAVMYGLDLSEIPIQSPNGQSSGNSLQHMSRAEALRTRVYNSPVVVDRQQAVDQGIDLTIIKFQKLQSETERFDMMRKRFAEYLVQLEEETRERALQDLQEMIEIMPAQYSKTLVLRMLRDEDLDPQDRVVDDVVQVIRAMPQDKLKKLFGEFKTAAEREELHRILARIGEFARASPQSSG